MTTSAAVAMNDQRRERPSTIRTSDGAIATTRNRPYTEGSQKTELTRKYGAYALELITFGFWKMSRVVLVEADGAKATAIAVAST